VANASLSLTPEADTHPLSWKADIELLYEYAFGLFSYIRNFVNAVVSKRFVKKQQMRWTQRGTHLLQPTRVQVLNDACLSG
jgi:hypothetical protein